MLWLYANDPDAYADFQAHGLLCRAVELKHVPLCRLLLERGANPWEEDESFQTVLQVWLNYPDEDVLDALIATNKCSKALLRLYCYDALFIKDCTRAATILIQHCSRHPSDWMDLAEHSRLWDATNETERSALVVFWNDLWFDEDHSKTTYRYYEKTFFAARHWRDACAALLNSTHQLPNYYGARGRPLHIQHCYYELIRNNITITHLPIEDDASGHRSLSFIYASRNLHIRNTVRSVVLLLIWASAATTPRSPLGWLPRELRKLIALRVWATRRDASVWTRVAPAWLNPSPHKTKLGNRKEIVRVYKKYIGEIE